MVSIPLPVTKMMTVMNLSPLSAQLQSVMASVQFGDHVLHFEHEEDGSLIRALVFCEKCDSEKESVRPKSALLSSASHEMAFIEMFYLAMKSFEANVHADCEEARKVVLCKEVLDE